MVPVEKKVAAGATTEAAIVSAVAPTVTAHVSHVLLCRVATSLLSQHAVTSQPTHLAVTSRLVIASALLRHAVIVQRLLRAATSPLSPHVVMLLAVTPHAVIVLSVVTASATLHRAVTSLPSRRVATSLLAANVPVATIHTPAHALIAPHQTALPTQVSQRAQRVISHLAPLHLVAKPSLLAATVQHALAHRAQAHHVPQPVHAAALTLTAVAVKAAR